jgi:hypothetical protein
MEPGIDSAISKQAMNLLSQRRLIQARAEFSFGSDSVEVAY